MSTPLSADRIVQALRGEGLKVVEHRSWRTHNRNHKGAWGPVHGVMIHHTVTTGTARSVDICYDGYEALPGPLCLGVIAKDGTVYLVGNGRANHAGTGDDDVLRAVTAEKTLPRPNENNTDGNARFYGFECVNLGDGDDPWPEAQLGAIERASAGLCRAHGWSERSVIGHKEWTNTKIDPRGVPMGAMRNRIGRRLDAGPADTPTPPPAPPAVPPFPGRDAFRLGRTHPAVTQLDRQLVRLGHTRHHDGDGYQPGPRFTEYTRANVADFQRSREELRGDPDGFPGPLTWRLLHTCPDLH